jgi:hypothetical protein
LSGHLIFDDGTTIVKLSVASKRELLHKRRHHEPSNDIQASVERDSGGEATERERK